MGFTELLTIVFIVLKLIGTINWSWWLVLLPEIIAIVFYISVVFTAVLSTSSMNRRFERMVAKELRRKDRFRKER